MTINRMRSELVLDRLRKDYRAAVNTLIAAGISEQDAHYSAVGALEILLLEATDEMEKRAGDVDPARQQ